MKLPKAVSKFVNAVTHPGDYVKAEINEVMWNVQQKLSEIIVQLIIFSVIALAGLGVVIFASITLALWLNQLTKSNFLGFLMVTGVYLILFAILLFARDNDSIRNKLNNIVQNIVSTESEISAKDAQGAGIIKHEGLIEEHKDHSS